MAGLMFARAKGNTRRAGPRSLARYRCRAVRTISGIVHLKGAIATTGTSPVPFTLPAGFRPATAVFVAVDLCNATNGRLQIEPTGLVTVQAEGGTFSNAACFTSLDGAWFAS